MVSIVLIRPEHPGNIGAVARAMANFGEKRLFLLEPQCAIDDPEMFKRAKHGQEVLEKMKIIHDLKKFDYLIGTTSRLGTDYNIPRSPLRPRVVAEKLKELPKANIAIVFGPEGKGLSNKEIKQCDITMTIPASLKYPTFNLSHSVAIILYELFLTGPSKKSDDHFIPAGNAEKKQLKKMFLGILNELEFSTAEKKETQKVVFDRIIGKSMMTKREAFAFMGFLRKIKEQ